MGKKNGRRAGNAAAERRRKFWEGVWNGEVDRDLLHDGVKGYHDETVKIVLSLTGPPAAYARKHVLQDPDTPDTAGLSDQVYQALGGRHRGFNPRCAGTSAIAARQHAYSAAIHAPKYDDLPDKDVRAFFKRCTAKAEFDLLESIEAAARHRGASLELGRP